MNRHRYIVEGWVGIECVDFRYCTRVDTVKRTGEHYAVDLGCDRVYVRSVAQAEQRPGTGMLAEWSAGRGWVPTRYGRVVADERLARALAEE